MRVHLGIPDWAGAIRLQPFLAQNLGILQIRLPQHLICLLNLLLWLFGFGWIISTRIGRLVSQIIIRNHLLILLFLDLKFLPLRLQVHKSILSILTVTYLWIRHLLLILLVQSILKWRIATLIDFRLIFGSIIRLWLLVTRIYFLSNRFKVVWIRCEILTAFHIHVIEWLFFFFLIELIWGLIYHWLFWRNIGWIKCIT